MIRASLHAWKNATEQLLSVLDVRDEDKRDDTIAEIEKLLEEREQLQSSIQPPFTEEENSFGKNLLENEENLKEKLQLFMKDIRLNISEQQKKKVSINAYMDPYSQVNRDGTFYDTKK